MRRSLPSILLALVAGLGLTSTATAGPVVEVTACEVVEMNGESKGRVTLSIRNPSAKIWVYYLTLVPVSDPPHGEVCRVLAPEPPRGWRASVDEKSQVLYLVTNDWSGGALAPSGVLAGLQMTLDGPACCFAFEFRDELEFPVASEVSCIECDSATPTMFGTWGSLKHHYR